MPDNGVQSGKLEGRIMVVERSLSDHQTDCVNSGKETRRAIERLEDRLQALNKWFVTMIILGLGSFALQLILIVLKGR